MPASCGSLEVFTLVKCSGLVSTLEAEAGRSFEFNTTLINIGRILLHPRPPQKGAHHGHCQSQIQWADEGFHVLMINCLIPFPLYPWILSPWIILKKFQMSHYFLHKYFILYIGRLGHFQMSSQMQIFQY